MPELPEVETVRLQLLHKDKGKIIKGVEVFRDSSVENDETFEDRLLGKTIEHISRVGKLMIFSFLGEDDFYLLAHLKMTGQFFFLDSEGETSGGGHSMTAADIAEFPGKHTRVAYYFTDNSVLYYNDMRIFGYNKLVDRVGMLKARERFGPEPIDPAFDVDWFASELKKKKAVIKAVLLDQSFIAGLGNIYVDEALWQAKIRPTRRANKVTKAEAVALAAAAGDVMNESIKVGGTTFQHFVDTEGDKGNYTKYLKVFGKQGTPCPVCGEIIKKIRCAGRGTHYCPKCQK